MKAEDLNKLSPTDQAKVRSAMIVDSVESFANKTGLDTDERVALNRLVNLVRMDMEIRQIEALREISNQAKHPAVMLAVMKKLREIEAAALKR